MVRYLGPQIDGDGATENSVGKLNKKIAEKVAKDQAKDPQVLLSQIMGRLEQVSKVNDELVSAISESKSRSAIAEQSRIDALKAQQEAATAMQEALVAQEQARQAVEAAKPKIIKRIEPPKNYSKPGIIPSSLCPSGKERAMIHYDGYGNKIGHDSLGCVEDNSLSTSTIDEPETKQTPPPSPTPPKPPSPPPPPPPPPKTAPIDTVLIDQDTIDIDIMQDLIWEDIGGQELINIARNDTVNGQSISYQPIKNITAIQQQYNPNNIVALQNTSDKYFANFSIKLETKLPGEGEGGGPDGAYVYIEDTTGDLIVELINIEPDEQIEVQISLSGTIYEAEFNES